MSDIKVSVQKDSLPEQASPKSSCNMHANKDEEIGVHKALPHKKDTTRRKKKTDSKTNPFRHKKYHVFFATKQKKKAYVEPIYYDDVYDERYIRNRFIKKVLLIVSVMLLITLVVHLIALLVYDIKLAFKMYFVYIMLPCVVSILVVGLIFPMSACVRKSPISYVILTLILIFYCLFCVCFTAFFRPPFVVQALFITILQVALCLILATTKLDFTKCLICIIATSTVLSILTAIYFVTTMNFNFKSSTLRLTFLNATVIVGTVMLLGELQMVLGGKAVELTEDQYALGAYLLYISIVQLLMEILALLTEIDVLW